MSPLPPKFRVRLQKIEANAHDVLREHQLSCVPGKEDELLDVREVEYAESYLQSAQSQLYHTFLANIPESMRAIPVEKCTAHRSRVFIEVLKEGVSGVWWILECRVTVCMVIEL